ncbi:MAG TPA: phosphotransferase [Pseudolysinimonas sp.]|jgi:aminoglycoside phosphotransferase (APT) family kinase protein
MARSHFTLAALATSAVAELDVAGVQAFGSLGHGDFDAALLTGRDGRHWIVRVPRSERAEAEQSADLIALRALSTGVRSRLPFAVSTFAGQVPVSGTRAVVYEFVYGSKPALAQITPELAASIGTGIAAIHALPTSFIVDAGLPGHSSVDGHRAAITLIDRAAATGLVPVALLQRWEAASGESALWQYTPTVINGSFGSDSVLAASDELTGVLGWHGLRVGDPALDLQWLLGATMPGATDAAFDAYSAARGQIDRKLRQRATLLSELEVARWLLHGTEVRSTEIVDDAVEMLSALTDDVQITLGSTVSDDTVSLRTAEIEELLDSADRMRAERARR